MVLVNVILPLPLDSAYTYQVTCDVPAHDLTGFRVRVPFSGRSLIGVVSSMADRPPEKGRLAVVQEILDERAALPEELMRLTRWLSRYYLCSWGEAARAALPPEGQARTRLFVALAQPDVVVRGAKQQAVLEYLVQSGGTRAATEVLAETGASHGTLRSLEKRGLVTIMESDAQPHAQRVTGDTIGEERFHPSQRAAADALRSALAQGDYRTYLLHGVTGSGKTEVYIDALQHAVAAGRSGIVLVPEIALTPQTVRRFQSHFGSSVAVLHSRLSAGQRYDTWRRIRRGDFRVVIGPRSAVFAPVQDLGLLVVDEEHESSYKQFEPAPRYNARDVAVMRASLNGAVCVLGSATPSLETMHNARSGKYRLLSMPDRVPTTDGSRARLPEVRIIDMLAERSPDRPNPIVSNALRVAIQKRLERQEQIILLQNRRGFAPVLSCDTCAHTPECPDCSVSLTWHKQRGQLRCHYCGRAFRSPSACASCGTGTLEPVGAGTQRVEEVLGDLFPAARVLRMDMDSTSRKDAHHEILNAFGAGEADVLVGTQMVAKGLDFSRVTLVGVVDADAGLLFPDFRADERTFQLLTQVAGRAGRADLRGEVLFQTRNSRHPVILWARRHDYLSFADAALATREALGYPPFTRAVRAEFRGPDEAKVKAAADRFAKVFRATATGMELVGPSPAFIVRVRRHWRYLALVKAPRSVSAQRMKQVFDHVLGGVGRLPKGVRINVDVDPLGML
ncbi:MAG: primosomal protein N' [Rhodothermales bacterium]|nr:primosomal protein N' [Rhodothermales bacterium]MBO6778973.1 primosomal protein N' [Rhodothermales bacterium]